jgi:hypothetical protein
VTEEPLEVRIERHLRENEAALREYAIRAERRNRAADRLYSQIMRRLEILRRAGLTR